MDGKKIYEGVKGFYPKHSNFDLSYEYKGSGNFGVLMPVYLQETLPGDITKVNTEVMLRFAPMLAPIMHRVNVYMHYFEVPNRLVWSDWEEFITGGDDGTASPTFPKLSGGSYLNFAKGMVPDYFGIPAVNSSLQTSIDVSQLPFRAYHLIWSEYYRDQNLQTEYDPLTNANSDGTLTAIRERAWEKDYFTSALPDLQKNTAISVAVTHVGPTINYRSEAVFTAATAVGDIKSDGTNLEDSGSTHIGLDNISSISLSSTVDINDLRLANRLQEWWERRSRGGSRYTEVLLSEFNVKASDGRIQRPRYLGGGKQNVVISEVLQTSEDGTTPLADMAGHGIAVGGDNGYAAFHEEHGYVIGILSIMPRSSYRNGVQKHFWRDDRFDYAWPAFAHLGEQAVENRELYFNAKVNTDDPTGTFGYQQRYAEYKANPSVVVGDFRDDLEHWHLTRAFTAEPSLNEDFILCEADEDGIDRIFATQVSNDHKIWFQLYHQVHTKRTLPYFSDPRL
jgi:hypothetical protein